MFLHRNDRRRLFFLAALAFVLVLGGVGVAVVRPYWLVRAAPGELGQQRWRAAASRDDPEALLNAGERLRRAGETEQAVRVLQAAYEQRSDDPRFAAALADAL